MVPYYVSEDVGDRLEEVCVCGREFIHLITACSQQPVRLPKPLDHSRDATDYPGIELTLADTKAGLLPQIAHENRSFRIEDEGSERIIHHAIDRGCGSLDRPSAVRPSAGHAQNQIFAVRKHLSYSAVLDLKTLRSGGEGLLHDRGKIVA